MKIPSEAELIEMEQLARTMTDDADASWDEYRIGKATLELVALVRELHPPAPIPPFAPRKRHRGMKVVSAS